MNREMRIFRIIWIAVVVFNANRSGTEPRVGISILRHQAFAFSARPIATFISAIANFLHELLFAATDRLNSTLNPTSALLLIFDYVV